MVNAPIYSSQAVSLASQQELRLGQKGFQVAKLDLKSGQVLCSEQAKSGDVRRHLYHFHQFPSKKNSLFSLYLFFLTTAILLPTFSKSISHVCQGTWRKDLRCRRLQQEKDFEENCRSTSCALLRSLGKEG